jgi:hypothetical protein
MADPAPATKQPFRSRPLGWLVQVGGWVLVAAAFALFAASRQDGALILDSVVATSLSYTLLGVLGGAVLVTGRKLATIDARTLMEQDPRPPVVYLRSFQSDDQVGTTGGAPMFGLPGANDEQLLVEALEPIGPVVGIGCPGENLATLGAARLYVGDDEWQQVVDDLLAKAALVVLRAGGTEGFWWEVERVTKKMDPTRLVIFLASWIHDTDGANRENVYQAFRERAQEILPKPLPETGEGASFLLFEEDWTPRPLAVSANMADASRYGPAGMIRLALRPVFESLGQGELADPPMVSGAFRWILAGLLLLLVPAIWFTIQNVQR